MITAYCAREGYDNKPSPSCWPKKYLKKNMTCKNFNLEKKQVQKSAILGDFRRSYWFVREVRSLGHINTLRPM